ncbi:MAG: SDR family oxidoreductase [Planctomycetales bacterium]
MTARELEGCTILITGGNGYLGSELARELARGGADIVIAYFVESGLDALLDELRGIGVRAAGVFMDVRDWDSVEAGFRTAEKELAAPTGVIACSAVQENVEAGEIPPDVFRQVIETNVTGTANAFEIGLRNLPRSRNDVPRFLGAIGSVTARQSFPGLALYGATKNFVDGLVRTYAAPAARIGARTWSLRPGAIPHPGKERETPGYTEAWKSFGLLDRVGTPQDVAAACRFLAGPHAAHITGAMLDVDGGNGLVWTPPIREVQTPEESKARLAGIQ